MTDLETTNKLLDRVSEDLQTLIAWADADAECSRESDAPEQARADFRRATALRKALELIVECWR